MQVVILAAGRGVRMGDLTEEIPKPLLKVLDKTLLEHKLDNLPEDIDEIIIVVGYLGDKIKSHLGDEYKGKKISYVVQDVLLGTADSLKRAKHLIKDRFMVMMGDDIYCKEDLENCLKHPNSILVKEVEYLEAGGKVILNSDGSVKDIIEGNHHDEKNAITNAGLFVLEKDVLDLKLVKLPEREEYGLPQTIIQALDRFPLNIVKSKFWMPMTKPEDLKEAEEILKKQK